MGTDVVIFFDCISYRFGPRIYQRVCRFGINLFSRQRCSGMLGLRLGSRL